MAATWCSLTAAQELAVDTFALHFTLHLRTNELICSCCRRECRMDREVSFGQKPVHAASLIRGGPCSKVRFGESERSPSISKNKKMPCAIFNIAQRKRSLPLKWFQL